MRFSMAKLPCKAMTEVVVKSALKAYDTVVGRKLYSAHLQRIKGITCFTRRCKCTRYPSTYYCSLPLDGSSFK